MTVTAPFVRNLEDTERRWFHGRLHTWLVREEVDGEPVPPDDFERIREAALATGSMRILGLPPF